MMFANASLLKPRTSNLRGSTAARETCTALNCRLNTAAARSLMRLGAPAKTIQLPGWMAGMCGKHAGLLGPPTRAGRDAVRVRVQC